MHSIDLKNYSFRTDLVHESLSHFKKDSLVEVVYKDNICEVTKALVNEECGKVISKKPGTYYTISFKDVTDIDNFKKVKKCFETYLTLLLEDTKIKKDASCLVIGLGNIKSTPDALGPCTIERILVTNYLREIKDEKVRLVSAIAPGVTGQTGIETMELLKGIISVSNPDFIITIDSLAASSIKRVNKTIQMANTGIAPGSGVGNSRKELSYDTLNKPVIAIGIPTVVDAVTVVSDTLKFLEKHYAYQKSYQKKAASKLAIGSVNYLNKDIETNSLDKKDLLGMLGSLTDDEIKALIDEVLTPIGYNLMVTPKEIDFILEKFAELIGIGINHVLNECLFQDENKKA